MKFYLDSDIVITPIGQNQYNIRNNSNGSEITIDEAGMDFFKEIDFRPSSKSEILKKISAKFEDAPVEEMSNDLTEFLNFLTNTGFVHCIKEDLQKLQINLTEKCNERCIHCYIPQEKRIRGGVLNYELILELIDQLCEMGGNEVVLSGGEALLHPNLGQIVEYAAAKGCDISILSNLSLLDDNLLSIIRKHQVEIQVSLYSTNEDVHDAITRRQGSCRKTMEAIENLRRYDIPVTISCIVMKTNKDDFTGVLDFGKQIGANVQCNCGLNMDLDFNDKNLSNRLTCDEVRDFYIKLFNHQLKLGNNSFTLRIHDISSMKGSPSWYQKQYPCSEIHYSCSINGNGDVCPCGSFGYVMGNIKIKSLKEIWNEAILNDRIFQLLNEDMGLCASCKDYEYCYVCPSVKYNSGHGDFAAIDTYMCRVAQIASEVENEFRKGIYLSK